MKIQKSVLLLFVLALSIAALAHNGMEHVMGTVKTISANSVTVETATKEPKTVSVALLPLTRFVKSGADVSLKELKAGDRVMIEAKENSSDKLEAVSVTFGKQPLRDTAK